MGLAVTHVQAVYRRVPLMAVSDLYTINGFSVWVKTGSRFHKPADLKGAKIGVTRFGGGTHAYSRLIVKSLGLEKDVTIVSAGGMREAVASLRAGAVDAIIYTDQQMIKLKLAGKARDFLKVMDFLPKPWLDTLVSARKDFIKDQPKTVRNAVRAILEANRFIKANPGWSLAKMKAESGFSDEAARLLYPELAAGLSEDGKIDPRGLKNINDFLFEFGIVPKGKPLPLEEIYTREFTG
jgi:ABC-type nitrate/sulfonate/bicarbonate transport system substrate-binding protein